MHSLTDISPYNHWSSSHHIMISNVVCDYFLHKATQYLSCVSVRPTSLEHSVYHLHWWPRSDSYTGPKWLQAGAVLRALSPGADACGGNHSTVFASASLVQKAPPSSGVRGAEDRVGRTTTFRCSSATLRVPLPLPSIWSTYLHTTDHMHSFTPITHIFLSVLHILMYC